MGDAKMTFRERNRIRLAKKAAAEGGVKAGGVDCYESGVHSKVGDFFIGVGIFVLPLFVPYIGIVISAILSFVLYKKYFEGRRFVKYGIISVVLTIVLAVAIIFLFLLMAFGF